MHIRIIAILIATLTLAALVAAQSSRPSIRFAAYDLIIDTQGDSLGAYQARIESTSANIKLVGVEGGEGGQPGAAFANPPTYDPRALSASAESEFGDRIILAAYTLSAMPASNQPIRVARIHVQITGTVEPAWSLTLDAAADATGKRITPTIQLVPTGDTP